MIAEVLYYIFIYPMQTLLGVVFEWIYAHTHSYGLSIIILSLCVNVFLLKLTNLSESKAKAISALKNVCDNKIKEFKKVFKGAELHAYTRTLFKQKHYHPIYNLFSLGGLALQIPFFLGVLFLLQDFEGLEGAKFGLIADLSKPDTLLFGYALLPFVMSVLSLVNVFISTKEKSARIQGSLIALIFLVLLYAMPSALVLYWSVSMAFSLLRTLLRNSSFSFRHSPHISEAGNQCEGFSKFPEARTPSSLTSENLLKTTHSHTTNTRILESSNTESKLDSHSHQGFAQSSNLCEAPKSRPLRGVKLRIQGNSSVAAESLTRSGNSEALSLIAEKTQRVASEAKQKKRRFILFGAKGSGVGINPFSFCDDKRLRERDQNSFAGDSKKENLKPCLLKRIFHNIFTPHKDLDSKTYLTYRNIAIFALLNIFFLIFVFSPFAVYSSDVSQFDPSQTFQTLGGLFGFFLLFSFLGIYLTSFFYKTRLLKLGVFACVVLILIAISYVFFFTGNIFNGRPYALLDGLLFKDGGANISHIYAKYFDVGYGVFLMFVALLLLYKLKHIVRFFLLIMFGVIATSSALDLGSVVLENRHFANLQVERKVDDIQETLHTQEEIIPKYVNPYLSFSKEQKNIIVLMSDTVQSDNFTQALKDFPELYDEFDGFTYYTNALSVSSITFASFPAIIGGEYYAPHNVNERILKHTLAEENSKAIVDVANSFSSAGYQVSFGTIFPGDEIYIRPYLNKDVLLVPKTDNHAWAEFYKQNYQIPDIVSTNNIPFGELVSLGLFRASPYIFRSRLYQAEGWLFGDSLLYNHYRYSIINASKLKAFAKLSSTDSLKPTFKLFHENTEHFPWLLDKDNECKHIASPSLYRDKIVTNKAGLAYSNHICYVKNLSAWLQWFKDSGIYDNTKIIIVSDHGNGGLGAPLIDVPHRGLKNSHIFFLFKDFNARGKLKIDSTTFVSNADAMNLACDEIDSVCPNITPSFIKNPIPNRELIFTLVDGGSGRQKNTKFDIILQYKVKNSIFDLNNWTDITNTAQSATTQSELENLTTPKSITTTNETKEQ